MRDVHPLGKSPAIRDGEVSLVESGAIAGYLVTRYGEGRLAPAHDSPDWPRYLQWLHFAEGSAMAQLVLEMFASGRFGGGTPSPAAPAIAEGIREMLAWMDAELAARPYFAGRDFSAADVMMTLPVRMAAGSGRLEGLPNLRGFLDRVTSRDAYRRAMQVAA
jgi:glutathione S-transferase